MQGGKVLDFQNLIGNEKIKQELKKIVQENRIVNSYLWTGVEGIGKKEFAKTFAKLILCQNHREDCHTCDSCIKFESENHSDFLCIEPDGKSIKIEQIRTMQEKVYEKPIHGERKVYILNDAEKMTQEAQNCLLKTLEEPPAYAVIILITSNEAALLLTIKSRCLKIPFEKISNEELKKYLLEKGEQNISEELLQLYDGSIGKALNLKEKKEEYEGVIDLVKGIESSDYIDYQKKEEILLKSKENIQELLAYFMILLYQKTKENLQYRRTIEYVEEAKLRLTRNANFDMTIDQMLRKIWEEMNEKHRRN